MPSQTSQEQSDLTQAQNKNGMMWTGFSGLQQARAKDTKCNLLNQDEDQITQTTVLCLIPEAPWIASRTQIQLNGSSRPRRQ